MSDWPIQPAMRFSALLPMILITKPHPSRPLLAEICPRGRATVYRFSQSAHYPRSQIAIPGRRLAERRQFAEFDGPHVHMFLAPAACAYTALDHQRDSESNQGI
jgi:hypothetical protein